jgi:hypothetical protein
MTSGISRTGKPTCWKGRKLMTDIAQTARKALEILDTDGWCKGSVSWGFLFPVPDGDYRFGSHCLRGAWDIALYGMISFSGDHPAYEPVTEAIRAQFPEFSLPQVCLDMGLTSAVSFIAAWNDENERTESDVRAILEKLAAS